MAFDRQQHYIELTRKENNAYVDIFTYFLLEKDNKVRSGAVTSGHRDKEDRQRSVAGHKGQVDSRSPYATACASTAPHPHRPARPYILQPYTLFVGDTMATIASSGSGDAPHNASR